MALQSVQTNKAQRPLPSAAALLGLALLACPLAALAAPQLQCSFDVNSETHHKTFGVVTDPYSTPAVPIGNRFRFKAIVLAAGPDAGGASGLESINLYVYYNTRRQPMVMQHTRFLQPVAQTAPVPGARAAARRRPRPPFHASASCPSAARRRWSTRNAS
jgi:hypothetical protein